jgi:hypothetical protein
LKKWKGDHEEEEEWKYNEHQIVTPNPEMELKPVVFSKACSGFEFHRTLELHPSPLKTKPGTMLVLHTVPEPTQLTLVLDSYHGNSVRWAPRPLALGEPAPTLVPWFAPLPPGRHLHSRACHKRILTSGMETVRGVDNAFCCYFHTRDWQSGTSARWTIVTRRHLPKLQKNQISIQTTTHAKQTSSLRF